MSDIPFNRPALTGRESLHLATALADRQLAGNGDFAHRCSSWLRERTGATAVLLTPSCTAALELAAMLFSIEPGDEVILPSFAFPTLGTAFCLRGASLVFVDIRPDTLGLNEELATAAITSRTRAIAAVNYGGVAPDWHHLRSLADEHHLRLLEDNAHGPLATFDDLPLGRFGDLGALSFHATKNLQCGEGGALLVNDPLLVARAEILQDKGTNRARFLRGHAARYEWLDLGGSALMPETSAAMLWAQLEAADASTAERRRLWDGYHEALAPLEADGLLVRPSVIAGRRHDGHGYHVLTASPEARDTLIGALRAMGIGAAFHFVPLHSSPAGLRYGRVAGAMDVTDRVAGTIVRLPLWPGLPEDTQRRVADVARRVLLTPAVVG